ncbi:hypothetical protein Q1695_012159 [Nippostrongylus brasiliensis]|nr:hypothetical protein Q1695_012159 [Nippostrongylus brasiliensis]
MTGVRRGSSFTDPPKMDNFRSTTPIADSDEESGDNFNNRSSRRHYVLFTSHFISTTIHMISSVLLYVSWNSSTITCGETSTFLTNLQAILIGIYALTMIIKLALAIRHWCHLRFSARIIRVISIIVASKQFVLAIVCEVLLEASTMVPRSGCSSIRSSVQVWSSRAFYMFSIFINAFFISLSTTVDSSQNNNN